MSKEKLIKKSVTISVKNSLKIDKAKEANQLPSFSAALNWLLRKAR